MFFTFNPLLNEGDLNSVQITEQLLLSHMEARSFFGSYRKGSE